MFSRVRSAFMNVVGGIEPVVGMKDVDGGGPDERDRHLPHKFPYTRPHFLQLHTEEEVTVTADHHIRPIIVPRDVNVMPWSAGYAEAVNAGKSLLNEDQACVHRGLLTRPERNLNDAHKTPSLPYVYFGIFDGHAGAGAAVAAANQLHHIIHDKLVDIIDHLIPPVAQMESKSSTGGLAFFFPGKEVSKESLIIGALESAFWDMDQLIGEDKLKYKVKGGCTALVALFINGKLFVANAGDSRGVLVRDSRAQPMSNDFTPESERQRVRRLAALQPELLGNEYTHLDYCQRPVQKDIGKRILYRDWYMTGWGYKTVTPSDLKLPVVHGEGKRSRVLATIGVTRGFGDHELKALYSNIPIKPFLLCQPEVLVLNLDNDEEWSDADVLVMGTDGLWDVTSNERVAEIVTKSFRQFPSDENRNKYRYTSAAQDLVMSSRGKLTERNWRTSEGKSATIDDISVFVIPVVDYKREHAAWLKQNAALREQISANLNSINSAVVAQNGHSEVKDEDDEEEVSLEMNGDDEIDTSLPVRLELH
ncbi:protein phosphatase 1H [Neocloeon triangulifer]|uniref:protein phosphatase 1H n=1 Tax=Neocloeon triangulifer TaxID=2078957 RepID=UPI00286F15C0|nr:protein phosphatase 1H [Neocloeon triangulifer]